MNCAHCDTEFQQGNRASRKYCSSACQKKAEKRRWKRRRASKSPKKSLTSAGRECIICNSLYTPGSDQQKYCSTSCSREAQRRQARQSIYGLSQDGYEALLERSGGLCEICQERKWRHIDHCHSTGDVRGLLCQQCNVGLGNFQDKVALLNRASEYLSKKIAENS